MGNSARADGLKSRRTGLLLGTAAAALAIILFLALGPLRSQRAATPAGTPAPTVGALPTQEPTSAAQPTSLPTPRSDPVPTPRRQPAMTIYESQMLGVIVVVRAAEKNLAAAVAAAKSHSKLKRARSDVEAALTDLQYARRQLNAVTPPRTMATVHRDVKNAVRLLIEGCSAVARGMETLNTRESNQGIHTFNQGLSKLRQAAKALHRSSASG